MKTKKKKIVKSCNNCVFNHYTQECEGKKEICGKWVYKKARCSNCIFIKECKTLGKFKSEDSVCVNHKKSLKSIKIDVEQEIEKKSGLIVKQKKEKRVTSTKFDIDEKLRRDNGDDENYSPVDLIESIIKNDFDLASLENFDDRDIKRAYNPVQFLIEPEFLGIKPYPMQLYFALEFYSAYCPYCSDTEFIRNDIEVDTHLDEILDRVELYRKGICKKCGSNRYEAIENDDHKFFNQLIGVAGQRSGKSLFISALSAVNTYQYLSLPNPIDYFGLLPGTVLHGTFVGLRYQDAFDNLWAPYHGMLKESNWFKVYHEFLNEQGQKLGIELYKLRDTFVIYNHKNITVYPSGPDKRKLRGRTRFQSAIDELGWFTGSDGDVKYDPDEVYTALDNSLMTIYPKSKKLLSEFPDTPTAYGLYISSPSSKLDKAMRMYKQSLNSDNLFGFHLPTWEINPNITKKDLSTKYAEDPVVAERDFGANPPFSNNPYINSPAFLINLFSKKSNIFKQTGYKVTRDSLDSKLLYPKIEFVKRHSFPCCLSIDTGYNNNSFALAISHWLKNPEDPDNDLFATSGLIEIKPTPYAISYPKVYEYVIRPILETFNVKLVVFDRWQSINLSQQIFQDYEIDAIQYSVNMEDFNDFRKEIYSSTCIFPKLEIEDIDDILQLDTDLDKLVYRSPVNHLFLQFLLSKDTGRIVTKGDESTDDLLRTVVLAYSVLTNENYEDRFNGEGKEFNNMYGDVNSIVKIKQYSNSGSSSLNNGMVSGVGSVKSLGG